MSKLLRNRWLQRALFACVLTALGIGMYHFEQPEPICEIYAENLTPRCFADDGRRFVTLPGKRLEFEDGPLQIWDCRTGAEIGRHLEKSQFLPGASLLYGYQRFAAETASNGPGQNGPPVHTLHLINLSDGTALDVPLDDNETGELRFTPASDLLARRIDSKEGKELQLYDSASGRLLAKHVAKELVLEDATDQVVVLRTRTPPAAWDLEVWSVPERRSLAIIPNAGAPIISRDGKCVVFPRLAADETPTGAWAVWSLENSRIEAEFQLDKQTDAPVTISPDNRWLVVLREKFVELRELPLGRAVAELPRNILHDLNFSPDGRWLAMEGRHRGILKLVAETPALEVRWEHADRRTQFPCLFQEFSADGQTLFAYTCQDAEVIAYDSEAGLVRRHVRLACHANPKLQMTPDHQTLLVHERPGNRRESWIDRIPWVSRFLPEQIDSVAVIDTNACRERFRISNWGTQTAILSDDGNTLVTQHDDGIIRCWDVNAYKPLYWPIGVPAGLAALGVLFAWWRMRFAIQ